MTQPGGPFGFSFPDGCRADGFASQTAQVQMALATLMDSAVSELFQQRSIPSSQTAFHLWASMDDLVANNSSRALLAFSQIWPASAGRVTLLDLGAAAMGEMVVGTSNELPPSRCCPGHSLG